MNSELIFCLVSPLGVDLELATNKLRDILQLHNYHTIEISISEFMHKETNVWDGDVPKERDEYIRKHQKVGNKIRETLKRQDALALSVLRMINYERDNAPDEIKSGTRVAYIVRQLKTKGEVRLLRRIYGNRLLVIGVTAHKKWREKLLAKSIAKSKNDEVRYTIYESDANELIKIDDYENKDFGQNIRDTYPMADVFLFLQDPDTESKGEEPNQQFYRNLQRFVNLILGKPDIPPTTEEYLMFQAHAVALRSADRSRQVGAVISEVDGSIISVGRNDDPQVGGGVTAGIGNTEIEDPGSKFRIAAVQEILDSMEDWLNPDILAMNKADREDKAFKKLRKTMAIGSGQFGRMVHAEMAAITNAAMRGISVRDKVMFCTTYPCENCAKHVMASGIRAIVHIEPYPKSMISGMYENEVFDNMQMLDLESEAYKDNLKKKDKLLIMNYLGVAPRRYMQLFTMPVRKNDDGTKVDWEKTTAQPRLEGSEISAGYERMELENSIALDRIINDTSKYKT